MTAKQILLEINIEPKDYAFTDYPVEGLCNWLHEKKVIDSHNQVQKKGRLIIQWIEKTI